MKLLQRGARLHRSGPRRRRRTGSMTAATGTKNVGRRNGSPGPPVDAEAGVKLRRAGTRRATDGETASAGAQHGELRARPGARAMEPAGRSVRQLESGVSRWRGAPLAHGGRPPRPERAADAIAAGEHAEAGTGTQDAEVTGRERRHGGCRGDLWWSSRRA